jgi:hypothetical protein
MPSFATVSNGAVVQAQDVDQIVNALNGAAGLGVPLAVTAVNDSVNFALALKNGETTNSRALQVLRANNVVLLQADANGVVGSVDGIAAAAQLVNVSLSQTLTNKTLTVPVSAPTADGALGEVAGGLLSVGNGTAAIPFGAYKIAETVLGSSAATFDFTSIPATFRHLLLEIYCRGDAAAAAANVLLRFNNDSAANYDYQLLQASAGSASGVEAFAQTSTYLGNAPAANAPANVFGNTRADIPYYANSTNQKSVTSQSALKTGTTTGTLFSYCPAGFWRSTAAINRITLLLSSGNFVSGSVATLYGLP